MGCGKQGVGKCECEWCRECNAVERNGFILLNERNCYLLLADCFLSDSCALQPCALCGWAEGRGWSRRRRVWWRLAISHLESLCQFQPKDLVYTHTHMACILMLLLMLTPADTHMTCYMHVHTDA